MKLNNKGLSLVEIVIVVAIISVMGGLLTLGVGSVVSKPAEECAMKMDSVLKNARVTTMGKQNVWIEFSQSEAGAPVYVTERVKDANGNVKNKQTEIGKKGITVTVGLLDPSTSNETSVLLSSCDKVVLSYNRSTGGFNKAEVVSGSLDNTKYVKFIKVTKGSVTMNLEFAYLTGKIQVK